MKLLRETFLTGLKRLRVNLNKPPIDPEVADLLYEEISFLPNESWNEIIDKALENWDSWPRNFPKTIKAMWLDWQRGRKAHEEYQNCNYCVNTGILDVVDHSGNQMSCFCGHCDNYKRHMGENLNFEFENDGKVEKRRWYRWTVHDIQDRGHIWDEPAREPTDAKEAFAAIHRALSALDEKSKKIRLPGFEQEEFDRDRPPF